MTSVSKCWLNCVKNSRLRHLYLTSEDPNLSEESAKASRRKFFKDYCVVAELITRACTNTNGEPLLKSSSFPVCNDSACCLVCERRRDGSALTSKASFNLLNDDTY